MLMMIQKKNGVVVLLLLSLKRCATVSSGSCLTEKNYGRCISGRRDKHFAVLLVYEGSQMVGAVMFHSSGRQHSMHEQPREHAMFERLSATFDDPYIDRMKAKALEVEELLNSTDFTIDERAALVKSLDDEWIYRHHTVFVTGEMWCVSPERRVPERRRVTGLEVQSDGFMFDPTRLELGDEFF